jgi:uncharacterized transporter YbjL
MVYIQRAVGLPAITAAVTSGNGVGFHFNVSAGMMIGVATSSPAAGAATAIDMRQATETKAVNAGDDFEFMSLPHEIAVCEL